MRSGELIIFPHPGTLRHIENVYFWQQAFCEEFAMGRMVFATAVFLLCFSFYFDNTVGQYLDRPSSSGKRRSGNLFPSVSAHVRLWCAMARAPLWREAPNGHCRISAGFARGGRSTTEF